MMNVEVRWKALTVHSRHLAVFIVFSSKDPNSSPVEKCNKVLTDLVHMNLCVLKNKDPSALDQSNRTTLNGKLELIEEFILV